MSQQETIKGSTMYNKSISLSITKPISAWNKPLKVDFRKLFISLTKATSHGFTGQYTEFLGDLNKSLSAIGFKSDPGQLAYVLIWNAIIQALWELANENSDKLFRYKKKEYIKFCNSLDLSFENNELTIDRSFFENPSRIPILEFVKKPFEDWLIGHGFIAARAKAITSRLNSFFIFALNSEWRQQPERYAPIKEALETPFTGASEKEQAWRIYYAWINKQVNESLFCETFSISQVYIPLRAFYMKKIEKKEIRMGLGRSVSDKQETKGRFVVDLEKELCSWITRANKEDSIRIISGGPGSGKSVFSKMFINKLSQYNDFKVLYIPLHQFDPKADLLESIGYFVQQSDLIFYNPVDPLRGDKRVVIIFDGLDELEMQGKVGAEVAKNFVAEVDRTIRRRNMKEIHLQIIISGRELIIQEAEDEFRKEGQILYLLPYNVTDKDVYPYIDPEELLMQDQRDEWWKLYGHAMGFKFSGMPQELKLEDFDEFTSQPLLNYLVALSLIHKKLRISKDINVNTIYKDMLEAVYERGYEKGRLYRQIQAIKKDDFIRVLEEIGLSTWHGDGRTTTVKEIQEQSDKSGLDQLFNIFKEGAEAGIIRLLCAFYFRKHGYKVTGEKSFEFTHKSYREYLTARRITRAIECIVNEFQQKEKYICWREQDCLKHWLEICGFAQIDQYLFNFLSREINLKSENLVKNWQEVVCMLINYALRNAMPMEHLTPRKSFYEETVMSRNAEEALLVILNICAEKTNCISKINWPKSSSASAWLTKLIVQGGDLKNIFVKKCLSFLDLHGCNFDSTDFLNANLANSNFEDASMMYSTISGGDLHNTNLKNANLEGANLASVNLGYANLEGANLNYANLQNADLSNANLKKATLRYSNCYEANFENAILQNVCFYRAFLRCANFKFANLEHAILEEANLRGAIFERTKMKGIDLRGSDLRWSKFTKVDLQDADIRYGNLKYVFLSNTNLTRIKK